MSRGDSLCVDLVIFSEFVVWFSFHSVTMALSRSVPVRTSLCLLLVFASNIAFASSDGRGAAFACNQVRELFEGNFGSPEPLHSHPQLGKFWLSF